MRRIVASLSLTLICVTTVHAQNNTVVFDNQSGEPALVKLLGPTSKDVEVPTGTKGTVTAAAGRYYIKVRYGVPDRYHYAKGDGFEITETATTRSVITITLHKVSNGNYSTTPIGKDAFDSAGAAVQPTDQPHETASPAKQFQSIFVFKAQTGDEFADVTRVVTNFDNLFGPTFEYKEGKLLSEAAKEIGREIVVNMRGGPLSIQGRPIEISIFTLTLLIPCDLRNPKDVTLAKEALAKLDTKLAGKSKPVLIDANGKSFKASDKAPERSLDALSFDFPIEGSYQPPMRFTLPWGRLILVPPEVK